MGNLMNKAVGGCRDLFFVLLACLLPVIMGCESAALAIGVITPMMINAPHHTVTVRPRRHAPAGLTNRTPAKSAQKAKLKSSAKKKTNRKAAAKKESVPAVAPQDLVGKLSSRTLAPGVVYKYYHGALNVNVIDVDMVTAPVQIRPVLAGSTFSHLADVKNHARQCRAIAAVNANYFKKDGTPLGTLVIDGEWVAGPLFDRVSMGITKSGYVRVDRVNLSGILKTSNPGAPSIWVNNINQPRRHGSHLILYTRRWGDSVTMPYRGSLVAVDSSGKVIEKTTSTIAIPYGGFALSDLSSGKINKLHPGDLVKLSWRTKPNEWSDVMQAVSGGPMLIKDGDLYVDLKAEGFRKAWTGRQIKARTACGVTAYNHLLLVTIEGSHTMWDFAKFLHKLGAVEAMNLDGGGSTTMVVNGVTVTRNGSSYQRRVASSLVIVDDRVAPDTTRKHAGSISPVADLTEFFVPELFQMAKTGMVGTGIFDAPAMRMPLSVPGAGSSSQSTMSQAIAAPKAQ